MTQKEMIVRYMKEYGGITQGEASTYIGCSRLAARIADIKADGISVISTTIYGKNRFGQPTHYTRYSLEA